MRVSSWVALCWVMPLLPPKIASELLLTAARPHNWLMLQPARRASPPSHSHVFLHSNASFLTLSVRRTAGGQGDFTACVYVCGGVFKEPVMTQRRRDVYKDFDIRSSQIETTKWCYLGKATEKFYWTYEENKHYKDSIIWKVLVSINTSTFPNSFLWFHDTFVFYGQTESRF